MKLALPAGGGRRLARLPFNGGPPFFKGVHWLPEKQVPQRQTFDPLNENGKEMPNQAVPLSMTHSNKTLSKIGCAGIDCCAICHTTEKPAIGSGAEKHWRESNIAGVPLSKSNDILPLQCLKFFVHAPSLKVKVVPLPQFTLKGWLAALSR